MDNIIVWAPGILHFKGCDMKWGFAKKIISHKDKFCMGRIFCPNYFEMVQNVFGYVQPNFWQVQNIIKGQGKNVWRNFTGLGN